MRALSRYNLIMGCALVASLGGGFFLNTWVNPWRITPMPWTSKKLDPYHSVERDANRTCKAGLAQSRAWDGAIFGSSRVDIGINPQDPAFGGLKMVNLGLESATIDENRAMFEYFMGCQESPKLVIFLIDAGDLTRPDPTTNPTDFSRSPLVPDTRPLERKLGYNAGITALSSSLQILGRYSRHRLGDHTPEGFRRVAARLENPRAQIASLYLSNAWRLAQDHVLYAGMNAKKVAMVQRIIQRCREKNTRLVFVFPPNHAAFQNVSAVLGQDDPYFEADRLKLAEIVQQANGQPGIPVDLWDFQDAHPLNCPALPLAEGEQMADWVDIIHFTPERGSLILSRIQGAAGDYGVRLTPEMVPARVEAIRAGLQEWAESHPDDLAFLRHSLDAFGPLPRPGGSSR